MILLDRKMNAAIEKAEMRTTGFDTNIRTTYLDRTISTSCDFSEHALHVTPRSFRMSFKS
jgi:hypothetical protein